MTEFNLLPTELEGDLRANLRSLLAARCDPGAVVDVYDGLGTIGRDLWKSLSVDLGLAGLLIPEVRGGHGASAREAAVVLSELGRSVAPVPFLTSSVIATTLLSSSDVPLLDALATGTCTAALVVPWSTEPDGVIASVARDSGGLSGSVTNVAGALEADVLLVVVEAADRLEVYAVAAVDAKLAPLVSLDMTRQLADVSFDRAAASLVLDDAEGSIRSALRMGAGLLASEQVGLARWCLEETVAYLKVRRQFGRVVGSFQALKHRLADLYTSIESGEAAAAHAAAALVEGGTEAAIAVAVAQSYCADLAVLAAEEAIQLHGGIGMSWEHPAHLYLKRAKSDQIALGNPGAHRARLAGLVDLPA